MVQPLSMMAFDLSLLLVAAVAGSASATFIPFAGVEELKPQRLHSFCGSEALPTSKYGRDAIRKCSNSFKKRLEDGGDVELSWEMHADPDSILSLDTEGEHGVRLTRCSPNELELQLPESHMRHAAEGQLIVASHFVHRCPHLPESQLLHRVVKVHHVNSGDTQGRSSRLAQVKLGTQELVGIAHAVPYLNFRFSYMPAEARDLRPFPDMVTDFGLNRHLLQKEDFRRAPETMLTGRRLNLPDAMNVSKMMAKLKYGDVKGLETDDGGFESSHDNSGPQFETQHSLLNFEPKQISNFGWNWDFKMNTTEEPTLNMSAPGARGFVRLHEPYVKVHAGIYLNFTSYFHGISKEPTVRWRAGINGHGHCQGRVISQLNTTRSARVDPFETFHLDKLEKYRNPKWFGKIDFAAGQFPFSLKPGFQMDARMYHKGELHGSINLGGRTHGWINPYLQFDSVKGFDARFEGELIDTDLWPPLWMIFTKAFEMGVMAMPELLLKGDLNGLEKATLQWKPGLI